MPSLETISTYGKAITLDDQGIYYVLNRNTGEVQTVIQLVYADDWCLYQLQSIGNERCGWTLMSETADFTLNSMTTEQIAHYLSKPEFSKPEGAWQVIRNRQYGFGKFTPANPNDETAFAILMFADNALKALVKLHKAETEQAETQSKENKKNKQNKNLAYA